MKTQRASKRKPEEIQTPPAEISMTTEDWQEFEHGVQLFNSGKFWHAHEAWELVWQSHTEDERLFFQGLIQLAAAYHQVTQKKSLTGLLNNFDKAASKLEVFQPEYMGIEVTPLLEAISRAKAEAEVLGPKQLEKFDIGLIPKLGFRKPENPDLMVEIRSILRDQQFLDGIKLFNDGYHWEAHEAWEDIWRQYEEGDAKSYVQAFVQMAAAYSFIKLSKPDSAKYLFEKSIQKLKEFEHLNGGLALRPLIDHQQKALAHLYSQPGNGSLFRQLGNPRIVPPAK